VPSPPVALSPPSLQQIPKEKEAQDHTTRSQHVFVHGDAVACCPAPRTKTPSQLRIVFDPKNGDRDDNIGASLHQPYQSFFGIRFREDDEHHDRMTKNFDPPLESHEGKIRPG